MKNLFDDMETDNSKSLISNQKTNEKKSKEHIAFDKLCIKLDRLKQAIDGDKLKFENILAAFNKLLHPANVEFSNLQLEFVQYLDSIYKELNLSKRQHHNYADWIVRLLQSYLEVQEASKDVINLYNKWHPDFTYEEESKMEEEFIKQELIDMIWEETGIDLDPAEFENNPEGYAKFTETMKQKLEEMKANSGNSKKTKKQLEKEVRIKAEEELKNKSLRKIYIDLAKLLHPDTSLDLDDKLNKEHIMKQVNEAYEQKDLYTLLKLEMEWMLHDQSIIQNTERIKVFSSLIKDQIHDLEIQRSFQKGDPRYSNIEIILDETESYAIKIIENDAQLAKNDIGKIKLDLALLQNSKQKRRDIVDRLNTIYG